MAGKYVCTVGGCKKSFTSKPSLGEHLRSHTGEKLFCGQDGCQYTCSGLKTMRLHRANKHPTEDTSLIFCRWESCQYNSSRSDNLKRHQPNCSRRPQIWRPVPDQDLPSGIRVTRAHHDDVRRQQFGEDPANLPEQWRPNGGHIVPQLEPPTSQAGPELAAPELTDDVGEDGQQAVHQILDDNTAQGEDLFNWDLAAAPTAASNNMNVLATPTVAFYNFNLPAAPTAAFVNINVLTVQPADLHNMNVPAAPTAAFDSMDDFDPYPPMPTMGFDQPEPANLEAQPLVEPNPVWDWSQFINQEYVL
ncbi:hypothetical protein LTR84_001507 [Exophiala bonariae]|uniref:C2H2 type master regulator of conidiophore development brlA n=1 Tax=Exophiala bonariae TaxID=1690606 RepID=A0AAV9NF11_9EURO|nr:hypothetical protein LTR84_001507 [Exophiala bonariae]